MSSHYDPSCSMFPRRVLHILGTADEKGAGVANIVCTLAKCLNPDRYLITALFLQPSGPLFRKLEDCGIRTSGTDFTGRNLRSALRLWRALSRENVSIIHQHVGGNGVRYLARRATGAKLVVHLHGLVSEFGASPQPRIKFVFGADSAIASSRAAAKYIVAEKLAVVYAGVPIDTAEHPMRADDTVVIGTACRLVPVKRISVLIDAIAMLRPQFPRLSLEIAGDGTERGRLQDRALSLGLGSAVRFLGWVPALASVLQTWDIFVLPSFSESFPIAIVEAMAAGLPVVATSVGGVPELVVDSENGWLVPPDCSTLLASRIRQLVLQPKLRIQMGTAGRARAQEHFSAEKMAENIGRIYDDLCS